MKATNITVAGLCLVLSLLSWQIVSSTAAETTTLPSQADREYTKAQKKLIDLGFQLPPVETPHQPAGVQDQSKRAPSLTDRVNTGVVALMSGGVNGTYIQVAADLASVLDSVENLRILPIIGKGSVQNITDLLYLKGVDICIVQSDVLSYLTRENVYGGLNKRVHYITKLYNEEFHLLAAKETESIRELAGKKINFGIDGSGTYITASNVFNALEIEVDATSFDQPLALEKLKQGEIAGMVYVVGKPARLFQQVMAEGAHHFLPVPSTAALMDTYLTSQLTAGDYPGLIPPDREISTVAVGAVLAVFNWNPGSPRYRNVARFTDAFFSNFAAFQKPPRHGKWAEVSLAARVPGWTRFKAAKDWLKQHKKTPEEELRAIFMQFLSGVIPETGESPLNVEQKALLFQEFMRWQNQQGEQTGNKEPDSGS